MYLQRSAGLLARMAVDNEVNALEKLALAGTRVPNDTDVDVPTEMHAFPGPLMDAAHQLQEQSFLDNFVTVHCRRH